MNRMQSLAVVILVGGMGGICLGAGPQYTVTDLGPWGAGDSDVNNSGQVVGAAELSPGNPHGFIWSASGGWQDLGAGNYASAINNSGLVVGISGAYLGGGHAFLWSPGMGMQDLGVLGTQYNHSVANGINYSGQVVGTSEPNASWDHAFLWTASGGMQDLGMLPGRYTSQGNDINSSGTVVGSCAVWDSNWGGQVNHASLWTASGGWQDLGSLPGGLQSYATAINNNGQVVGYTVTNANDGSVHHAFIWTANGGMQDLGSGLNADDINNSGQVVGCEGLATAFVWTSSGGVQDLNGMIDPNLHLSLWNAYSINDYGQIVVRGEYNDYPYNNDYFLLTPLPEPATMSLLAVTTLVLLRRKAW